MPDFIMTMLGEHVAQRGLNASQPKNLVFVGPQGSTACHKLPHPVLEISSVVCQRHGTR